MELTLPELTMFFLLAMLAEILGTLSGFGSSILFVPIAGMFLDFQSVLGITALFHVFSNLSKITLFRKGLDRELLWRLGIPSVGGVIIGAWFSDYLPDTIAEMALGAFLVAFGVLLLVREDVVLKRRQLEYAAAGGTSGLMAGLLGTGGAIRGLALTAFGLSTASFLATSAAIDMGVDLSRFAIYWYKGYLQREELVLLPMLILVAFVGSWIGKLLVNRIAETTFRRIVLGVIIGVGVYSCYSSIIEQF